jgi:hypothetical protein
MKKGKKWNPTRSEEGIPGKRIGELGVTKRFNKQRGYLKACSR